MGTECKNDQSLTSPGLTDFCNGFLCFLWIRVCEAVHRQGQEDQLENETVQEALNIMGEVHPGFGSQLRYLLAM